MESGEGERNPPQGRGIIHHCYEEDVERKIGLGDAQPLVETVVSFTHAHRAELPMVAQPVGVPLALGRPDLAQVPPITPLTYCNYASKLANTTRHSARAKRDTGMRPAIHRVSDKIQ
ncbi:hypothetical protein [Palleronia aestuarii]|uniref:hypothetical protein n=1 Tax=Palleronia aestuarii TaxID=568105 RepID=UPI0011B4F7F3|nr:hypothetical protein [Palleronia aestuarii]